MADADDRREATGRRSGDAFDALAGARVLGEIQAEGLRAAGALVDRLVHLVDGSASSGADDPRPGSASDTQAATEAWFDLWGDLMGRATRALGTVTPAGDGPAAPRLDLAGTSAGPTVELTVVPGGTATTELWLHNATADDLGPLAARCAPLVAPDGVAGPEVVITPARIDGMPARSSRGLIVSVSAATDLSPATYRGVLQVDGAPEVWAPIVVLVESGAAPT